MKMLWSVRAVCVMAAGSGFVSTAFAQGSLTPPGAPAPTMKTLQQVEPRIPISVVPTNINVSGSYYLTANLTGINGQNGISVNVGDVTIDLNGFALVGVPASFSGIGIGPVKNITVQNGIIRNWGSGGVSAPNATNVHFVRLQVANNGGIGLNASLNASVSDCLVNSNNASGIAVGDVSVIDKCNVLANLLIGVSAGRGSRIADCSALGNGSLGIGCGDNTTITASTVSQNTGNGIVLGAGCTVNNCTASQNTGTGITTGSACTIKDCVAQVNGGSGIVADRSRVSGCMAWSNSSDGIQADTGCLILENDCRANLVNEIHVTGTDNRIDGNHANGVSAGSGNITVDASGANIIIRNTANGFVISGSQMVGPIITATGTITTNNPWANFQLPF